ncbi:MAG: ribulose-phosphate 3-epimerase [Planctomycetaceae bacterium]|nr:ribulose-phosphate 3-epimerase [Planctomycetaceae bacterium]
MTPRDKILQLRNSSPLILPSLLLCDFGDLRSELQLLEAAGVQALHLDVMDGIFVPNMTYGMPVVEGLARHTQMPLDVHLMVQEPIRYIDQFAAAGSDLLTVHVEACSDLPATLKQIRELGVASGVALNPDTPLEDIVPHLDLCDLVLCMSVNAGFGGQQFNPVAIEKFKRLNEIREQQQLDFILEVDGGINTATIADCYTAGATWFVAGSSIFKEECYTQAVADLIAAAGREIA